METLGMLLTCSTITMSRSSVSQHCVKNGSYSSPNPE